MKVLFLILLVIGLGILAAVVLSTFMVVMITGLGGWLASLGTRSGKRERRTVEQPLRAGRLARQEKM